MVSTVGNAIGSVDTGGIAGKCKCTQVNLATGTLFFCEMDGKFVGLNSTGSSHLLALTVGTSLYCFCATSVVKPNFCPTRPWRKETRKEHLLRTTTGQHEITASFTMNAIHSIHKCYHDMICMYVYLGVCLCMYEKSLGDAYL